VRGERDGEILGIITAHDITCRGVARGLDPWRTPVSALMTRPTASCHEDDALSEAINLMEKKHAHPLPVYDRAEHLVGMLALADATPEVPHPASTPASATSRPPRRASRHH
jgi:CBS domain-containing protein